MTLPPPFVKNSQLVNAVIETPSGSTVKYKFEQAGGYFRLNKVLPEGFSFPHHFGFIPSTQGEDGDPLDIILLLETPACTGAVVASRLIGVLEARQKEKKGPYKRNDRFIA